MTALTSWRDVTLADVRIGLDEVTFSSLELVKPYVVRLKDIDQELRPVLEINEEAEMIAGEVDEERRRTGRRG